MVRTIKFSIVTINLNNKAGLVQSIQSLSSQSFPNLEFIVVDGGSNDGSVELIEENASSVSSWISEKDHGIYDAMNKGIDMATGDYVYFLNAGDAFYDSAVLSDVATALAANDHPDILFGNVALTKGDGREVIQRRSNSDVTDVFFKPINHQSIFAARDTLKDKFNTEFRMLSDYHWFLGQLTKTGTRIFYLDRTVSLYDVKGFSGSNRLLLQTELRAVRELYFRKGYVSLLSGIKGTKLMYLTKLKVVRAILNRSILKFKIDRQMVANV